MAICPICHKCYTRPDGWKKAVCPKCFIPPKDEASKAEPEPPAPAVPHVVVFLAVDGPRLLGSFDSEEEASRFTKSIYSGENKKYNYLRTSIRIRVWTLEAWERSDEERVVIPAGQMDGIDPSDFDPQSYI